MNTRGINEYCIDKRTGYLFDNNPSSCATAIRNCIDLLDSDTGVHERCIKMADKYKMENTESIMNDIYQSI